jgi:3-deoxy-D-manno-octulosonate 8-phosphate phosphatase (KDO 8-P phosphatase)
MDFYLEKLKNIRAFVFDVDGVFTDGKVWITGSGELLRSMHTKDGLAVKHAVRKGYPVGIISGGRDASIRERFAYLGVYDVYLNTTDKIRHFEDFLKKHNLQASQTAYMGDDIPDIPVMKRVGLAVCPADAAEEVKAVAHYVSPYRGGETCVRDLIEKVLKIRGDWFKM